MLKPYVWKVSDKTYDNKSLNEELKLEIESSVIETLNISIAI